MIRRLLGLAQIDHGQIAAGVPRSPKWASWVKRFVRGKRCIVCGRNDEPLTGHHIVPFHVDQTRELDRANLTVAAILPAMLASGAAVEITRDEYDAAMPKGVP